MAEPGKQLPEPVPSNTPSLSYKSASEVVLQEEDPLSSSQRSGSPAATTTTDDTDASKRSPEPRRRSGAMSHVSQIQHVQHQSEEAITVGGGDIGTGEELSSNQDRAAAGVSGRMSKDGGLEATRSGTARAPAPQTILNGLKLKHQGHTHPTICYTYTLSPFMDKPVYIDWKIIVNDDIQSQHIRCHALQPGDKIKDLVSSFKRALAKAVVLINTQDNYTLAPELIEGMEKSSFPVIILTKSDGNSLVEFLERFYQDVIARLDVVNTVDVAPALSQQQPSELQQQRDTTVVIKDKRSGSEATGFQRLRQAFGLGTKTSADLKNEVKRLMFTSDTKEPVVVSDDDARFVMVMSAFTVYEKQAKPDGSHSDVVDVLRKLKQHLNECFPKDVPLYLILSYRFHITHSLYDCDELGGFISGCIERLESMEPKKVASAISTFLEKDDFKVSLLSTDGKEFNTSVLFLLESACIELARVSYNIHRRLADTQKLQGHQGGQKPFCQHFVYSRMMWTSLTLRLHDRRTATMTRSTTNLWQDNLLKHSARVNLDLNAIREVKRGLELGRLLKLSADTCFNYLRMTDFLVAGKTVRPLSHVETYFRAVESYITFEADLADFLANIRANYDLWLRDGNSQKLATASADGTLLGTIKEGIGFVDCMNEVCTRRKVDHTLVESDSIRWVLLLLHLVNFTDDKAGLYLKQFLMGRSKVLKIPKCRIEIKKYILNTTQANFPHMSIQQFGALFKAFKIYSPNIVEQFLKTYKVQPDMKIDDPTWHSFISEVVVRFGGARNHFFLLDFLQSVATGYLADRRQKEFILDLLQLSVPKLFAVEEGCEDVVEDMEVTKKLTFFLRSFINRHALKHSILIQMTAILDSIAEERNDFQQLILGVLQKEVIPEFKVLQGIDTVAGSNFQLVLKGAVSTLCKDLSWLRELTTKQKFCWGLVAACCSKINISRENLDWVHSYDKVLKQVGYIYTIYCNGRRLPENQCIIIEQLPEEVVKNPNEDIRRYFEWVREIQTVLKEWQDRFLHQKANYDEILLYASNHTHLHSLGNTLCITSLICDAQDSHQMKTHFLQEFESLNISLLKYIPEQPDAKWCTLPALLQEYGVALPRNLQEMISKYVLFPGDEKPRNWEPPTNPVPPATTGRFQPGHEVSLQLSKNVSLYQLAELITELSSFQEPLLPHLDMLVFFKLNKSVMFDKYLRVQIGHNTEKLQPLKPQSLAQSPQFSAFSFSIPIPSMPLPPIHCEEGGGEEGLPVKIFIRSLENTKLLLSKVMKGDAKYSEIIAEGALDLENLDITKEFAVLVEYSSMNRLVCTGLSGVQNMLELFQYSNHIHNIYCVCDQYKLKGCLGDPSLKILKELVGELRSEDARAKLTPNESSQKMQKVKATLGFTEKTNSKCLDLFAVIRDSAVFYQFVRDKQFYGEGGSAIFYQQYQLITAQLQHEEYDEQVLNHLFAAFKLMAPFMDQRQDLGTLMSKVLALDVTNGLRQLETVNANITLIRLWFSRAEGDTLENVAKELDSIIQTGYYIFTLSRDSSGGLFAQIMLEYKPSTTPQHPIQPGTLTTSGHHSQPHSSSSGSDQNPFSFEAEGTTDNPPRTLPRLLTKMESQSGNDLFGTSAGTGGGLTRLSNLERWNTEQIGDFVRKLGFLDKEKDKEGGDKIIHFLHVNEVAYKLLELYIKLRELGHIQYINEGNTGPALPCTINPEDAEERVKETEVILTTWTHEVANLRKEFRWLLFFSVPKLLRLYQLLSEEQENRENHLKEIVHEISFLCVNNADSRKRMNVKVQRAHEFCKRTIEETEDVPVKIVGAFLNFLFEDHSLPHRCRPSSPLLRPRSITSSISLIQEFVQMLHFCPGYTQDGLIRVIVGLYTGVPESFEVFHCRPNTSEEELNLFLKRAAKFPLQYLILEVNKLPYKLQEHLMQLRLLVQQEVQGRQPHLSLKRTSSMDESVDIATPTAPVIHFVETAPSVLREMPWIQLKEHKEPKLSFDDARKICVKTIVNTADFACIQLVYGFAGDGKTHYIKSQLEQMDESIIIAVNEAFTPLKAIFKLRSLPLEKKSCGIFFNFTMLPPGDMVDEKERERYHQLMEVIGWFFFDLFILGYVEDPDTGKSFRMPGGLQWAVYIEVPSREHDMSPGQALKLFCSEVPILGLIGTQHMVKSDKPYSVNEDVQLVCKYLKALSIGGTKGIDKLYREGGQLVKFSLEPNLSEDECQSLLRTYMSEHVKKTKITQRLFIKYMKRRCMFLDTMPGFNYNTGSGEYILDEQGQKRANDTRQLGSTLMKTMLSEVKDFCDPDIKDNWSHKPHQQLIYDFKDGGGSLGLISLHPEKLPDEDKRHFLKIGVEMPSMIKLYDRGVLDGFLSRALNVETDGDKRITIIDDSAYVLTLDYTIKMLNIHERYECGVPVIIEGETGVGKTALVEMLSKLWNQSLLLDWRRKRARIIEFFQRRLGEIETEVSGNFQACVQAVENITSGSENIDKDGLVLLCHLPDGSRGKLFTQLMYQLLPMKDDPVVALLTVKENKYGPSMEELFDTAQLENTAEATADLLHAVLTAQLKSTFHKINVHAAMTPADIQKQFKPVFEQATALKEAFERRALNEQVAAATQAALLESKKRDSAVRRPIASFKSLAMGSIAAVIHSPSSSSVESLGSSGGSPGLTPSTPVAGGYSLSASCPPTSNRTVPFVTVFLDEVNTSSCVGLFKEIIVDKTFDGEPIPDNVFIVAACNPHRGNSLATHVDSKEKWVRGSYYVRRLHPTLRFLMWDYGSLDESQERDYINSKMKMLNRDMSDAEIASLTNLIVTSQNCMRTYAYEQLLGRRNDVEIMKLAQISSRSCVSQRDIQRVFTLYQWLLSIYERKRPHGSNRHDYNRRAVLVALGIVYYMRLNAKYRAKYQEKLNSQRGLPGEVNFTKAFEDELDWYIKQVELPKGIARTQALKENLFATIICTVTHIPLIIVGAPGSSKTLSFNQAIANLKGPESKRELFRDVAIFSSLDPHYYQCSRRTTSNEIQTVFSRAINRQRSHRKFKLPIHCVVFMDEAGLPEESHESLKVLHYHLDKQEVSFVAITNHVLDAAKTNRAVSLFRPEAGDEDLKTLAMGCLCSNPENPPPELKPDLEKVVKFCPPYSDLMKMEVFAKFFGLRDFIHFVNYLRRKKDMGQVLTPQIVMQALERNFNGCEPVEFEKICKRFFKPIDVSPDQIQKRGILEIVRDSLQDRPQDQQDITENEVRYKLIIDPSEDDSLVRLLFAFGVLKRDNTRMYVCSDFPGDSQLQKINTIAAIRHSAIEGHTVVMSQTDDIHESFYDLFNQRFRRIDDPEQGPRYYTNIAIGAHLKPSRVHPNFQCVVVVKKSEIKHTPAPFLNRFEKYLISYSSLLETAFNHMPPCMAIVVKAAIEKTKDFIQCVSGSSSLYGLQSDTLESLVLTLLPPLGHKYETLGEPSLVDSTLDVKVYLVQELLQSLRHCAGFHIPPVNASESELDAEQLFEIVLSDPVFEGLMEQLDHGLASRAVVDAINTLHTASKPEDQKQFDLSPEGCMVISLLQQWFVRYFCKKLMQLMTSEALILNRNKIPFSYLVNYLIFQNHFSLKDLIERYYTTLEATGWDISGSPNKVLCFTRSSPLIHQLPAQYPSSIFDVQTKLEDIQKTLKDLVFEKTEQLVVCKLSSVISQTAVQELLKGFIHSDKTNVCVIVANMQETSRQIVNHLRIMIEETEALAPQQQKLFIFLLHFPPAQFFKPCYPSLFLKGWDHCYLDTIAHSAVKGVIDIRDWFWQCCFPSQPDAEEQEEGGDSLVQALNDIIPQAIPILSSRVFFGVREGGSFSAPMNGSSRSKALKELLFDHGVGKVLCERFRSYWKPPVMAEYLDRAASFSKNRESTLNITDSIQTMFKTLFFDFLVYMISRINDRFNIDILFNRDGSPALQMLFIDILHVFPLPSLSQVNVLSSNLQAPQQISHVPSFPFFTFVSSSMEKLVEKSQEEANIKIDIMEDNKKEESINQVFGSIRSNNVQYDRNSILVNLQEAVCNRIRTQMNEPTHKTAIVLAMEAISKHPELWPRYFSDFILHKMKLETDSSEGIAQKVLEAFFEQLHSQDALQRMVILHTYLHVYQLDLAKMAGMFRPLNKIQKLHKVSKTLPHALSPLPSSPSHQFLAGVKDNPAILGTPEHLATFVIETLFSALVSSTYQVDSTTSTYDKLTLWFKAYRDVMTLPTLKKHIYRALEPLPDEQTTLHLILIEAKLNVLHATYLALLSEPQLDEDLILKGQQVFQTLFSRHFEENQELRSDCPRLSNVTNVAVEVLTSTCFTPSLHRDNQGVRRLMEGLFAHFFSADRQDYHSEDIDWFLELANEQDEWRANLYEADADVISGDLSDDILTKFEKSAKRRHPPGHPESTDVVPHGAISLNMFKLYLGRILGTCPKDYSNEDTKSGPLELYKHEPRTALGRVLASSPDLGSPGPYIPVFYQESPPIKPGPTSDNALMQQPLAHLYFLTVLEHLMTQQWLLSGLVRSANSISQLCNSSEVCDRDKVLLWIELQAVVQVIAQNVPHHLDPSKQDNIVQFNPLREDINRLLNDDAMGGGKAGGHAMVVALHLYKLLKSSRRFTELMTKNFETTIKGVDCLIPFNDQLKVPKEPTPHLLPFMLPGVTSEQAALYRKVSKAMYGIHHNKEDATALVSIAQECSQTVRHSHGRGPHHATTSFSHTMDKHLSFRMMVWLVSYYEFYDKNITSSLLCNIIGGQEMSGYLKEEGYIRLIQCFLNPALMLNRPESPNPLTGDQQVLELLPDGGHRPLRRHGQTMEDPLYKLFVPDKDVKQDQSDVDLRHSIANMVAMVMGCPSHSNHLWYHMFAADKLVNTYMTGFMYDAKISPEGLLYDCGVELSPDGKYGRQDYMKHASRGTYTLHSLYLLLWANFGAFCMALLTQTDSDDKIHGNLISDWISVRHYCVSQLRTLWMHMRNNLGLSEEERTFFVMRAMKKFYELVLNPQEATLSPKGMKLGSIVPHSLKGFFKSREELDKYEKTWHLYIYQPTWNELKSKFAAYSQYWQSELFLHLRRLELHYPHFPSEEDFTHRLLGTGDLQQHSAGGELMLLSRFSMEWPILQAGGLLLPKLVEFYQWLHTQLAHLVTYEKAITLPIRRVVELATKRYNKDMGDHLLNLYDFLKAKYNKYVELIGGAIGAGACAAIKRGDKVYTIADDVPLLHFLTDVEEEEQGNDWLFTVIDDIVSTHNMIIETIYSFVSTKKLDTLSRLLPDEPAKMYPSEIDENNCLVGEFSSLHGVNEFLQLIRSRYRPPLEDSSTTGSQQDPRQITLSISENALHQLKKLPAFQLAQLEEDIIASYFAGKPLIHKPSLLRTIFKFRQSQKAADAIPKDVGHSALDLADMTDRLPEWYKTEMEDMLLKRFEYEFHSANYHALVEVITGLRTVIGHLIKEVIGQEHPPPHLETLTVPQFMLTLYEHITQQQAVLNEIGITNLTATQMDCLVQLPLTSSVSCMLLFASWVDEGFYDFCNLPFPLKTHMSEADRRAVEEELWEKWTGSVGDLLRDVKQLIDVLKHSEGDITKKVNESSQKPIINYLIDYHMLDAEDQLAKCIPTTILLQHYVSFRQALRRLRLRIQLELEGQEVGAEHTVHGRWPEFVNDLWQERLPHLRQEVYGDGMFMFDPTTGRYGFQEGSDYGTEDEFMTDLMNEPEHQGDGEREREGEGEGGEGGSIGGLRDVDDSFEELDESEALEPTISHSFDLDQMSGDEEEKGHDVSFLDKEDLKSRLQADPELKKKLLSVAATLLEAEVSVQEKARKVSVQDVANFLASIKMDKYIPAFQDNEISGDVLISAKPNDLSELGVESALDKLKILVGFKRHLEGSSVKFTVSKLVVCLSQNNLVKYRKPFEQHGVDGDLLLYEDKELVRSMLKEIGIDSNIAITRIISRFDTFASVR